MAKKLSAALFKAACYTLLFVGMQLLVSAAFALIAGFAELRAINSQGLDLDMDAISRVISQALYGNALLIALVSNILSLLFIFVFFTARKKKFFAQIYIEKGLPALAYLPLLIGGVCLAGFVGMLLDLLPIPQSVWDQYEQSASALGGTGLVAILATVLVTPVAEEVFFRGLVYTRLRRAMPSAIAMVLSSLVFGLLHAQFIWICYATAVGLVMALVFERTGTVRATIALHLSFNLAGGYLLAGTSSSPALAFAFAAGIALCWIWLCRICAYTKLRPEDDCNG